MSLSVLMSCFVKYRGLPRCLNVVHALLLSASMVSLSPVLARAQPSGRDVIVYDEVGFRGRGDALTGDWRGGGNGTAVSGRFACRLECA